MPHAPYTKLKTPQGYFLYVISQLINVNDVLQDLFVMLLQDQPYLLVP